MPPYHITTRNLPIYQNICLALVPPTDQPTLCTLSTDPQSPLNPGLLLLPPVPSSQVTLTLGSPSLHNWSQSLLHLHSLPSPQFSVFLPSCSYYLSVLFTLFTSFLTNKSLPHILALSLVSVLLLSTYFSALPSSFLSSVSPLLSFLINRSLIIS